MLRFPYDPATPGLGTVPKRTRAVRKSPATGGEDFAQRLRSLRKQRNLSQAELAKLVGLHYIHVGRYERGEARPSADTLKRLADALGVSSDYLLEGSTVDAAKARFEDRELLRQFQEVQSLPEEDKQVIKTLLEAFLMKRQLRALVDR
jgi:transcriptional regulator with XRE-family HTH domain